MSSTTLCVHSNEQNQFAGTSCCHSLQVALLSAMPTQQSAWHSTKGKPCDGLTGVQWKSWALVKLSYVTQEVPSQLTPELQELDGSSQFASLNLNYPGSALTSAET